MPDSPHYRLRAAVMGTPAEAELDRLEEQLDATVRDLRKRIADQADALRGLREQLEAAQRAVLVASEGGRIGIEALVRQRDDLQEQLEAAQTPAWDRIAAKENKRLQEQLEAAQRERSEIAQRARSYFIDYEDDCPHPLAMFLDDISVDPAKAREAHERSDT